MLNKFELATELYNRRPDLGWEAARKQAAEHYGKQGPPVGIPSGPVDPAPDEHGSGAASLDRHLHMLQAAKAKHPGPTDWEREWVEIVLSYLREHPQKSWEQACRDLGIRWQMGPSKMNASGLVIQTGPDGVQEVPFTPGFWPDHPEESRVDTFERAVNYVREHPGISYEMALEKTQQTGQSLNYQRSGAADVLRRRRFDRPGEPGSCVGFRDQPCGDGGMVRRPVYE
jgi:hypothetical protein